MQVSVNPFEPVNNFGKVLEMRSEDFGSGSVDPLQVYLVWGLRKQDMSDCEWGKPECDGETRYDDDFNLNDPESQLALYVSARALDVVHMY